MTHQLGGEKEHQKIKRLDCYFFLRKSECQAQAVAVSHYKEVAKKQKVPVNPELTLCKSIAVKGTSSGSLQSFLAALARVSER